MRGPAMQSRRFLFALAAFVALACFCSGATAQSVRPEFREPVVLASKDGVLEVRLTARQGEARLDTVARPVRNFLLFGYELIRGTASDGNRSADNLYPGPTLQVFPGEKLIVHFENDLRDLAIRDFFSPQYTPVGQSPPTYPGQMTESPVNLHVHGLHISPRGNADNVLLHIPAGMANTYVYDVPTNMPQGAYWYHSHLHGLSTPHIYSGLVGFLAIGRTDGNLPVVTEKRIPIRNMVLQYNYVFGRGSGLAHLNNPYWPQFVDTRTPPVGEELANGTYRPLLTPVNFDQAKAGETFFTVWYAGPLSIDNVRGRFQYIPSNLQRFTARGGRTAMDVPADPALADHLRDVQFTVNGQFQPTLRGKAGQTEIWVLANMSDVAYMNVQLTETATGRHPPIAIVGQDGAPLPAVNISSAANGTRLLIPPASRFAIAVTIPQEGELVLEMPSRGEGSRTINAPGVLYTSNGTANPPAILGDLSVVPSAVSYLDGFFAFPTQVLARAVPSAERGEVTAFVEGQSLGAYTSFVDLSGVKPDLKREIRVSGGFLNNLASKEDPKTFVYAFDGRTFPNTPVIQPRLNSVEEWRFSNHNNDEHPIHVHVNDFQVVEYFDPTTGERSGPLQRAFDNANLPSPTMQSDEGVIQPAILSIRTRFDDYIGLFVMHCHRLNHEDNGLMALINVLPAVSVYAVAVPGAVGQATVVRLYDGKADQLVATVTPFAGFAGAVSVAMADLDGDGVLDLLVGGRQGSCAGRRRLLGQVGILRRAGALPCLRRQRARRHQRRRRPDRRHDCRQHHRRVRSGRARRGQGLSFAAAVVARRGTGLVRVVRALWRRGHLGREPRRRLRRFRHRPRQHRHGAGSGQAGRDQGVRLPAVPAGWPGRRQPAAGQHRHLHGLRRDVSRRRLARDRLAGRCTGRRQAYRRRPARRRRNGRRLLRRLGAGWRAGDVPAQSGSPRPRCTLPRDRALPAVRLVERRSCRHDQHDGGCASAGERHGWRHGASERPEVRSCPAQRAGDDIAGGPHWKNRFRVGLAASPAGRQLRTKAATGITTRRPRF